MLWALKDLPVRNEYEIQQTTSAVATTTAVTGELNGESMVYTTDILQKVSSQMLNLATVTRTPDDSSSLLVLQGASNVLEAMIRDEYHGRLTVKIAREIIEKSNNVVQTLMKASIKYMIVGEEPIRRQTDLLYAMAGRYKKSIVPILKSDAAVFVLPDNLETVLQAARVKGRPKDKTSSPANLQLGLDPLIRAEVMNADEDCYQAHMVTFKENPYTYGSHPDVIHTQVASLTLYTCQGDELTVENLTESEVIDIVLPHEPEQDPDGVYRLQKHQMNIHEFNLTATNRNQVLHIDISLLPAATGRLFPLAVLLRASEPPEPDKYLRKWQYPPEEQNITISITEDLLTEGVTFYIGLVDAFYNEGRRRPGQVWQRDYKLKLWWGQCLYWDNEQHIWSTNGCQLKPSSSFYQAHCSCSHLSSFGAHLSLEPNDLDSTNLEDFFNLNENPVSFSLVTTILVVYVVLLIVCRRKDRYDERKKTVVHLIDNKPTDKQLYVVTLETGFRRGAGTTAKVSIVLHGEEGMSETRELISEDEQPLFERNSRDTFILTFPDNLGPIFKVQIWHNNAGSSPSWYLSRVTVWDVNTDHVYYFICEKWFAVEEEDEKVEREITVSDHGLGFTKVALAKGSQYFADYHMWFSPLTRPSYSNFTRAQRLTCCLCLLLSYMAVNAAWYKSQEREYRGEFGLIDISWRSVLVGIITALIVLPPNMIIVLLFRKSKVTTGCSREVDAEDMYKASRKRDSMSSITSDAHIQPVLQTSIFDQTLINWQSLQDWAQKTWAKHQTEIGTVAGSEFRPLHPEDDADGDRLPGHLPADGTGSEWSPGSSTRSQAGASTSADESGSDSRKSYASHKSYCSSGTKGHSDSGSNPTPVPPTANKQARVKPRPPVLLANQMQPLAKHQQLGRGSEHGSPKSDRSTSESSMTYTTTSTEKSCDKSSGSHDVRSRWSESKSDYSGTNVSHLRYSRRRRYHLPEWCRYVAWVLCSLVIAGCATITVLYGFSFGHTKSVQWLQSLFFSFIQCAFITHPIIILVVSVVVGIRYQNDLSIFDCHDSDLVNKEVRSELKAREKVKEEEDDCDFEKGVAARQRSRYLRFTRPPQEKQLIEARMRSIKERKASAILSGTAQFLIKFILLMFMAFGKDLRPVYNLNEALKANLVRSGSPSFDSIRSVPEWWQWTQTHFLDTLYWDRWYNGQPTHFEKEYIDNSVMIGHINMRQLRIREQPCQDTNPFSHLLTTRCRYPYSPASLSQLAFGHNTTWWYMRSEITGANSVSGKHGRYDGDGFLVLLSKNKQQARSELEFLQSDMWIDKLTRVVITEFTLFHPQSNLFTSVKLLIETPATGGVSTTSYIRSVHLYRYMTALDNFVLACELLFIAVTFFKLYHVTVEFLHHRDEYLKNPWHWCVMTQGLLSLTFIVCYIYRFMLVADTVEHLRATYHEVYVDVSHVEEWDDILRCLIGFISLLVILELVRALRNRRPCAVFVSVIHHASADILVCLLMFAIWLVAYSCLGAALYVSVSPLYSQPHGALLATVGLFGRHFDFSDVEIADFWSILGLRFFVASFLVFALGSLTAYIMAVMNFHYKFYKHETILIFSNKETLLYYWDKLLVFLGFKQPILSEDDEVILPPEFTMAEIEYQVDEMLFKMNALAGTANLPEKPPVYFTDSDTTYGLGDDSLSSAGSEVRGYEEDNKLENRIRKIEERLQTDDCFSQLVQADKDVLTLDKEKQLRNQLEMEIFRQLQVHRGQTKGARPKRSTTNSSSTAGYRTSLSHSSSGSSSHSARHTADQTSSSPSPLAAGHGEPPGGSHSPSPHPNKLVQRFTFPRVPGTGKTPSSDKRQQISDPNYDNRQNNRTHSKCSSPDGVSCSCEQPGHGDLNPDQLAAVQAMRMPEANERHVTNIPLENMTMERHRSRTEGPLTNLSNEDDATQRQERSGILRKSQSQGRGKGRHPLDDIGFVNKAFDSEHDTELDRL